jgi:NTP pyrophosphatase (non-canonical NTP hydrolase)
LTNNDEDVEAATLTFDVYQVLANATAVYPAEHKLTYPLLGLCAEVGEFANKYKKVLRDGTEFSSSDMASELGDILWYVAAVASDANLDLENVAFNNYMKLRDRMDRGVIRGSGDNR